MRRFKLYNVLDILLINSFSSQNKTPDENTKHKVFIRFLHKKSFELANKKMTSDTIKADEEKQEEALEGIGDEI